MNGSSLSRAATFLLFVAIILCSPMRTRGQEITTDYKVSPQDILIIGVVGEKDLTQECRVSSSGTITYQWCSNVDVAGKTAAEIEQHLRKILDKDYLVEPTVLVAVKEYRVKEVTVLGFVNKPGTVVIPAEQRMTVMEAIGKAQGISRGGNPNNIKFSKRGTNKKIDLRMDDLLKVTDPEKMIYVEPGDVIEVMEKAF